MKQCCTYWLTSLILLGLFTTGTTWAAHPAERSEIENLKKRIEILESQKAQEGVSDEPFSLGQSGKFLRLSGLLEFEAVYENPEEGSETSNFALATVELAAEVKINDNIAGHVILLWEDGPDPIDVDEAAITLNCPKTWGGHILTFSGGKMYLPFGKFNSYMISDPLTLELGETNNSLVLFALEKDLWSFQTGIFNGDTETSNSDSIDAWVAALEITPLEGITLGASYISDLAESDNGLVTDDTVYTDSVAGFGSFLSIAYGIFSLEAEYILALDDFTAPVVTLGDDLSGKKPSAWNLELAWIPNEQWQIAMRTEAAHDFKRNSKRYGAAVSYGLFQNTLLALEYLLSDEKGAASDPVHVLTMQLALTF